MEVIGGVCVRAGEGKGMARIVVTLRPFFSSNIVRVGIFVVFFLFREPELLKWSTGVTCTLGWFNWGVCNERKTRARISQVTGTLYDCDYPTIREGPGNLLKR